MGNSRFGLGLAVVLAGCLPKVAPDAHTGRDGTPAGARHLREAEDAERATGIISARGGDASDWFQFEIGGPGCEHGEAAIRLGWEPARPGQRLTVRVFDEQMRPVKVDLRRRHRPRLVADAYGMARGRYFLEVAAADRDAAARYTLAVVPFGASDVWACYR